MNRQALVKRYLELQDKARKLSPATRTPHITSDMSNEEIVRLGKWLAGIVNKLESFAAGKVDPLHPEGRAE